MTKEQSRIKNLAWRRTFAGYFYATFYHIRSRCKGEEKYVGLPVMSREDWDTFLVKTRRVRMDLHRQWVLSGYTRRMSPSIDRIDGKQGYVLGNCRWMAQHQNSRLGALAPRKPRIKKNGLTYMKRAVHWAEMQSQSQAFCRWAYKGGVISKNLKTTTDITEVTCRTCIVRGRLK